MWAGKCAVREREESSRCSTQDRGRSRCQKPIGVPATGGSCRLSYHWPRYCDVRHDGWGSQTRWWTGWSSSESSTEYAHKGPPTPLWCSYSARLRFATRWWYHRCKRDRLTRCKGGVHQTSGTSASQGVAAALEYDSPFVHPKRHIDSSVLNIIQMHLGLEETIRHVELVPELPFANIRENVLDGWQRMGIWHGVHV